MVDAEKYMMRCIELAKKGLGYVNPNPLVGSVIVKNGKIISEGWHVAYGHNHAERMAILNAVHPEDLEGSDIYVNLEPCSHFGKTPPCADLIVDSKFRRVFVGFGDPNPLVSGAGIQRLRANGIEVFENILVDDCCELNRFFYTYHTKNRPFVTLKWAETANGFMAPIPLKRQQISGEDTLTITHSLRAQHAAILVGVSTWEIDKPSLNNRLVNGPSPLKMVLDPQLRGTYSEENAPVIVFNLFRNEKIDQIEYIQLKTMNIVEEIFSFMMSRQLNSILVEGGAKTLQTFIDEGVVDEIHTYSSINGTFIDGLSSPHHYLKLHQCVELHSDIYSIFKPVK